MVSQMSMVLQDPYLFSGTVSENIRYSHEDATDEEVAAAAKAVGAHDFIMALEGGYNSELSERGSNLSVGQRQLISFARAIVANPRILVLDEATASIDTHTEILIQNALKQVLQGRTSIVIAHRLSTIPQRRQNSGAASGRGERGGQPRGVAGKGRLLRPPVRYKLWPGRSGQRGCYRRRWGGSGQPGGRQQLVLQRRFI